MFRFDDAPIRLAPAARRRVEQVAETLARTVTVSTLLVISVALVSMRY